MATTTTSSTSTNTTTVADESGGGGPPGVPWLILSLAVIAVISGLIWKSHGSTPQSEEYDDERKPKVRGIIVGGAD